MNDDIKMDAMQYHLAQSRLGCSASDYNSRPAFVPATFLRVARQIHSLGSLFSESLAARRSVKLIVPFGINDSWRAESRRILAPSQDSNLGIVLN